MKRLFLITGLLAHLVLASTVVAEEETSSKHKIAVQALPVESFTSLNGGDWHGAPHHFLVSPGDYKIAVDAYGFSDAVVPLEVSRGDMFVEVKLKRKRGYYAGLSLFCVGASAVLPGIVLTITGALRHDAVIPIGTSMLGAGAALSLTGGLVLLFGAEQQPEVFVAPLTELGEFKP